MMESRMSWIHKIQEEFGVNVDLEELCYLYYIQLKRVCEQ